MTVILQIIKRTDTFITSCEIGLRWVSQNPIDDKSTISEPMLIQICVEIWRL